MSRLFYIFAIGTLCFLVCVFLCVPSSVIGLLFKGGVSETKKEYVHSRERAREPFINWWNALDGEQQIIYENIENLECKSIVKTGKPIPYDDKYTNRFMRDYKINKKHKKFIAEVLKNESKNIDIHTFSSGLNFDKTVGKQEPSPILSDLSLSPRKAQLRKKIEDEMTNYSISTKSDIIIDEKFTRDIMEKVGANDNEYYFVLMEAKHNAGDWNYIKKVERRLDYYDY